MQWKWMLLASVSALGFAVLLTGVLCDFAGEWFHTLLKLTSKLRCSGEPPEWPGPQICLRAQLWCFWMSRSFDFGKSTVLVVSLFCLRNLQVMNVC